jgi:hypothetical protein
MSRVSLEGHPDAVCNDGSPASFYYRNCSANWDRKPGGPDFCSEAEVGGQRRWIVVFGADPRTDLSSGVAPPPPVPLAGAYCWDGPSCAARAGALTTSVGLPATAFPSGVLLP